MSRTEVVEGQVWEWVESSCVMRGESKRGKQETTLWKGTVIERQNIMKFWKDYTIEDATIVTKKGMKTIKSKIMDSSWRKLSGCCV